MKLELENNTRLEGQLLHDNRKDLNSLLEEIENQKTLIEETQSEKRELLEKELKY